MPDCLVDEIDQTDFGIWMDTWNEGDEYRPAELVENCVEEFWAARAASGIVEGLNQPAKPPKRPNAPGQESAAEQLEKLRQESRLTIEQLAEKVGVNVRTVQRHLADDSSPYLRHLTAYERVFSKLLKRDVVIKKMP